MKRLLPAATLHLAAPLARPAAAQDPLTRRNGTEVLFKALEVRYNPAKHHRFGNLDGPQEVLPTPSLLGAAPAPTPLLPADGCLVPGDELRP